MSHFIAMNPTQYKELTGSPMPCFLCKGVVVEDTFPKGLTNNPEAPIEVKPLPKVKVYTETLEEAQSIATKLNTTFGEK